MTGVQTCALPILARHLFIQLKGIEFNDPFIRLPYSDAISFYGTDKPDLRFGMKIREITDIAKGKEFQVFDTAEFIGAIACPGASHYTRKQTDELTDFVKRPQVGAKGLVWIKQDVDGLFKSSVDKFYSSTDLSGIAAATGAEPGDLILILAGERQATLRALGELRLEMGSRLGLRPRDIFVPLWVVDFPLLEWNEEQGRYFAMHHPFTSPKAEDVELLDKSPGDVRANAYDLVINGVEIGGGSIRIHDSDLQRKMFRVLGFTDEEAQKQFGFLLNAFRYGAPPHGGVAFGFDRWTALMGGSDTIRDFIAFPKNNSAKDVMIDSPSTVSEKQLQELSLRVEKRKL